MSSADHPPIRIGNDERAAAMAALDEHLAQGRLDVEEYGDRSAAAANAKLAGELAELFTDLPAPHPTLPGHAIPPAVPSADGAVIPPTDRHPERPSGPPGPALEKWGPRLVAASPVLALVLFLLTRQWWWFLLIPLAGALVYGGSRRS